MDMALVLWFAAGIIGGFVVGVVATWVLVARMYADDV